jgi:LmbE family N-acetylglucosaminyl deacetylase
MKENKTVLVVAAHPDDEVLGCGGTIARHAKEGDSVFVGILGEGITSRYAANRRRASVKSLRQLKEAAQLSSHRLGVRKVFMSSFPDNRFDTVPLLEIIKVVESWMEAVSPSLVYTHHAEDLNIDHRCVHQAVLTATRPTVSRAPRSVYSFEVPSATDWAFSGQGSFFQPNVFFDIAETLIIKEEALLCYKTEMRPFPHPRSLEAIRAAAIRWGSVAGVRAAEAFKLIREIR